MIGQLTVAVTSVGGAKSRGAAPDGYFHFVFILSLKLLNVYNTKELDMV